MRLVFFAALLLTGGCVEAVDLAEPIVLPPAYCDAGGGKVVICDRLQSVKTALRSEPEITSPARPGGQAVRR
jgi:hypothetical protein